MLWLMAMTHVAVTLILAVWLLLVQNDLKNLERQVRPRIHPTQAEIAPVTRE